MKWLKLALVGLFAGLTALTAIAYVLPRQVRAERSIVVAARPATIFTVLNGFGRFNEWSPWAEMDPSAVYSYEGPTHGVGAKLSWVGDPSKVGSGSQTILEIERNKCIRTALDFGEHGTAMATFVLEPQGDGTHVKWGFETDVGMNPVGRYVGLWMDRLVGPDFERGLARLKTLAESLPKADLEGFLVEDVDLTSVPLAYVEASVSKDEAEIVATLTGAYGQVRAFLQRNKLEATSGPITINTDWDDAGYRFQAALAFSPPEDGAAPQPSSGPVLVRPSYAGKALKVVHRGSHDAMQSTYDKLLAYAAARGAIRNGPPWDEYLTDPAATPEAELLTIIYLPIQ